MSERLPNIFVASLQDQIERLYSITLKLSFLREPLVPIVVANKVNPWV